MATKKLTLKSGDLVLCMDDSGTVLSQGVTYTVASTDAKSAYIILRHYGSFRRDRFRKVTKRAPVGQSMRKSHKSKRQQVETKIHKLQNIMTMPRDKAIATVIGMIAAELKSNLK